MDKKDINNIFSSEDQSLLDCLSASYLSIEDVKWLKSKRWFKRFIKIYSKELKKRYKDKPVIKKEIIPKEEDVEILDFTRTIDITDTKDIIKSSEIAKRKVKKEKMIWTMVIVVSSVILIILLVVLVNWGLENKKTYDILSDVYDAAEVKEITTTTKKEENTSVTTTTSLYDKYESMNILEVNFDN